MHEVESALFSVLRERHDDLSGIRWSDGSVTVEHWEYSYTGDPELPHLRLTKEQADWLRTFLNAHA